MTYKDCLKQEMESMATDPAVCFIGYGVKIGGRAAGTLANIPDVQLIETPVAENLIVGFAIGQALMGRKPVVFIERFDFITNALDAIVNHLAKIETMSRGQFNPNIILRVVVGNRSAPLFTGMTHTQDFSDAMRCMVNFPVIQLLNKSEIQPIYQAAKQRMVTHSTMIVEYKDKYAQ